MSSEKEDKEELYNLIIRTKDVKNLPDVEYYVRDLHKNNFFKDLIEQGRLTVEEVQKQPFAKMCDIFFRKQKESLETGDIIIFKKSGNYEFYLRGIV